MAGPCFISCSQLSDLFSQQYRFFLLDGSMFTGKDTYCAFLDKHIPTAQFFDQQEARDKAAHHPLAYPSVEQFRDYMTALRVPNDGSLVVVYDQFGMVAGPRVWFLLRYFGYQKVVFLDGGLPKWEAEGRKTVSGPGERHTGEVNMSDYQFEPHEEVLIKFEGVRDLVDRLSAGTAEEILWDPRNPSVKTTTDSLLPGCKNVFYQRLLNPDLTVKSSTEILSELSQNGIDLSKPIITTCNRGVISCTAVLLLANLGKDTVMYAGSWMDWTHRTAAQ